MTQKALRLRCKVCRHQNVEVIDGLLLNRRQEDGRVLTLVEIGRMFGLSPAVVGQHRKECLGHLIEQSRLVLAGSIMARRLTTLERNEAMFDSLTGLWDAAVAEGNMAKLKDLYEMLKDMQEQRMRLQGEGVETQVQASAGAKVAVIVLPTLPASEEKPCIPAGERDTIQLG